MTARSKHPPGGGGVGPKSDNFSVRPISLKKQKIAEKTGGEEKRRTFYLLFIYLFGWSWTGGWDMLNCGQKKEAEGCGEVWQAVQ